MPKLDPDIKEYDQLIERHKKLINFLCLRASYGQKVHYSDLVQECYIELLKCLSERTADLSATPENIWVYWKCRSAITRYRRSVQQLPQMMHDVNEADSMVSDGAVTQLTVDDLAACLDGVERHCFLLMADGADDEELERELGIKHRSLIQLRHNIKKKLQQYLMQ